jgi:hypothetical protein
MILPVGVFIIFFSAIIATAAAVFERILQKWANTGVRPSVLRFHT